jgi:hypothetical protein
MVGLKLVNIQKEVKSRRELLQPDKPVKEVGRGLNETKLATFPSIT